jgi:Skp family chaperone for outer membrane proteins
MRFFRLIFVVTALFALLLTGCNQSNDPDTMPVVVIDLEAIAEATGEDIVIQQELVAARSEQNSQHSDKAAELEAMLEEEKAKLKASSDPAQQDEFDRVQLEAQQQFAQAQAQAQQESQRFQAGLLNQFHEQVKPVAARVSAKYGAKVIFLADPSTLWFEDSAEITDEVITALKAEMSDADSDSDDSDSDSESESDEESAASAESGPPE